LNWRSSDQAELTFESLKWDEEEENLMAELIDYLDKNAKGSIVVIDSLTALAQYCLERMEWKDMIMFLRGLQKASKKWGGIVYAMLSEGIFEKGKQEEIQECMDGVVVFEWDRQGISKRQRIMYMKKFRGLLPVLDEDNIVNFEIQISSQKGFEVSNIKRVRGR
jgi:archaellum biogenesis ATPase FlaH